MRSPPGKLAATTVAAATISSGKNFHPQQIRKVPDPEEDPFQDHAALADGLIRKLVEQVESAVAAERACAEGPHRSLNLINGPDYAPRRPFLPSICATTL
jgi:hypothetical protein